LKKSKPTANTGTSDSKNIVVLEDKTEEYRRLIEYYRDYFKLIDKFHFNSSQTRDVFRCFLPDVIGKVIPVITSGIRDKRKALKLGENVRFGFIGSLNDYKGFPILKKVTTELYSEGYENFRIYAYAGSLTGMDEDCPLIEYKAPYKYSEISDVLYGLDCVIVPSKWYETFSLVALESLAHGRPVIVSDHVGAKDIVADYNKDMVFSSQEQLKNLIRKILENPELLISENKNILSTPWNFSIENHAKEIMSFYNE
jgi:glycosyltransferase, family 1